MAEVQTESQPLPVVRKTAQQPRKLALPVLIALYSLLIAFYALVAGSRFVPPAGKTGVEEAALDAARALAAVNVTSSRFGQVGLCSLQSSEQQVGLNTLMATLRLDSLICQESGLEQLMPFIKRDSEELHRLEKELAHSLYLAVQPNYFIDDENGRRFSIYERAYRDIARGQQGRTLVALKLNIGKLQSFPVNSMTRAARASGQSLPVDDGTYYYCHIPVAVPGCEPVNFYELAPQPTLVDSAFSPGNPSEVSSVVQVEATFESVDHSGFRKIVTHESACAVAGAAPPRAVNGAFMLSFPFGSLSALSSLRDFLNHKHWQKPGEWHQAVNGDVPGEGHLAPPLGIESSYTACGEATALCFYHWLSSLGPDVNRALLESMLAARFDEIAPIKPKSEANVTSDKAYANSAIVRDTGASRFALLYQSKPGGLGQQVLSTAFSNASAFPRSALPMAVDGSGFCRLPGRNDCDTGLISDFLDDMHKTNVAAIETKSIAETVLKRVQKAKQECDLRIAALNEELHSMKLNSSGQKLHLQDRMRLEENNRQKYLKIADLSVRASMHAKRTIDSTYELSAEISRYASLGLNRITAPCQGYLLSRSLAFIPHTKALTESELYAVAESSAEGSSWLEEIFEVAEAPDENMSVDGIPIMQFWQTQQVGLSNLPVFVIYGSGELRGNGRGRPCVLRYSPYAGSGLGRSQLLFYDPDALHTGTTPQVRWSLLARDLVAFKEFAGARGIAPPEPGWWTEAKLEGDAPELRAEVQLRSPVPIIPVLPSGSSVQNPSLRESIPLVPPMPAELL